MLPPPASLLPPTASLLPAFAPSFAVAGLAVFVEGLDETDVTLAVGTRKATGARRLRMSMTGHGVAVRQEVWAMMALNMLSRWLNGREVASEHGWIHVVESLCIE